MKTTRDPALELPNAPASDLNRKPKSRVLVWLKRIGMGLVFGVIMLSVIGAAYQAIASQIDIRSIPSPGQMVDVGGYHLHISCTGVNIKGSPTVILETGLGGTSSTWAWVQPEIAKTTRVCAYDRAGVGWSDSGPRPRDARQIAEELHTLLHNANIRGPYVLAGWSFGGLYIRSYAGKYPGEVSGLVLIDSSSPDMCNSTPGGQDQCASNERIYTIAPVLARVAVMRVMGLFQPPTGLPDLQNEALRAAFSSTKYWDAQSAEFRAWSSTSKQVSDAALPDAIPLFVLTTTDHGTSSDHEELWQGWQSGFTMLSTNSIQRVVSGASHSSIVLDEVDAKATVEAILKVIEASRTGQPLASSPMIPVTTQISQH